jgi:hypothetical protein
MIKNTILGYSGFVGSHLLEKVFNTELYNSKNIKDVIDKEFNLVYCCCLPSVKWYCNKNPEEDNIIIDEIKKHISNIKSFNKLILISTIDIHDNNIEEQTEDNIEVSKEYYGLHRFNFEQWLINKYKNKIHIIRLPALFGIGIKKSALYDLLNDNNLHLICSKNLYQWYDLRWLYDDIEYMLNNNIKIINAYSEPIIMKDIINYFFPTKINDVSNNFTIKYNQKTKYNVIYRNKETILKNMEKFIFAYKGIKLIKNLTISNLHWNVNEELQAFEILKKYNIDKIEIVPSKYNINYKNKVYSIQSLLYGIEGNLRDSFDIIIQQLNKVFKLAKENNCKILVFGAPKLRNNCNIKDLEHLLKNLNIPNDIYLCIEPNAQDYGCTVCNTLNDVYNLVKEVNNPQIKINFDTGNALMENDTFDIIEIIEYIEHIQISMPFLKDIDEDILIKILNKYPILFNTSKFISLEINSNISKLGDNIYTFLYLYGKYYQYKTLIIGTGWYGCYTALLLNKLNITYDIIDKNNNIMQNSSINNQNRLHLGFHYPRNYNTRNECKLGYYKFIENFPNLISNITSYYLISNKSLIDYTTFTNIFKYEKTNYKDIYNIDGIEINFNNIDGNILLTDEKYIDPFIVSKYFKNNNKIKGSLIKYEKNINYENYSHVFDCTYGQLLKNNDIYYELCVILLYKCKKNISPPIGITIMDGDFFSIYPYDITHNIYTITHVIHTPILVDNNINIIYDNLNNININIIHKIKESIEKDILEIITNFYDIFEYQDYFTSIKTKFNEQISDDRSLKTLKHNKKMISFIGGKITGIFDINKNLNNFLNIF